MTLEAKMSRAEELSSYAGEDKIITFEEKRVLLANDPASEWDIKTGLPTLDRVVGGFRPGNLIVVSAPTAQGKTSWCQTITKNISAKRINSLWFPFEGDIRDFLERLQGVTVEGVLPATLKSNTMIWLKARMEEAVTKYGIQVVFIDHLHYLIDLASSGNASLTIGAIVRQIKLMAVELNLVIFLICHIRKLTSRDSEGNFRKPSLADIRDTSLIGQEADYVFLLWRKQAKGSNPDNPIWTNRAMLSLQKNRRTGELVNVNLEMRERLFAESAFESERNVEYNT